jgi:4-amino-4-deoxy-L-arabinose transferase-like glycosyltransferase
LISPIAGTADDRLLAARWVTSLCALGCVWLVFLIGEQLKHTLAGFIAALFTAVNSFFLLYSFFVTMEVPMVFLMLLSLYCLVRGEESGSARWQAAAGVALAGAVLTKEFALGLAVVYGAYGLFVSRQPNRLRRLLLTTAPAIAALLAWVAWAWAWSPVQAQADLSRWFVSAVSNGLDSRMNISVSQWSAKLGGDLLGWSAAALLGIGLYFCFKVARKEMPSVLVPMLYVPVAIGLSYIISLKELRHHMAVVPMTALVIGVGVSQLWGDLQLRRARVAQFLVGGLVVVALLDTSPLHMAVSDNGSAAQLDPLYAYRLYENDRYYRVLRSAGNYLAAHAPPGEVLTVVHEATVVSLYADRPYSMLYVLPFDAIMEKLPEAHYLVFDDRVFPQLDEAQIQAVVNYVTTDFHVEVELAENGRSLSIFRNADLD